MQLYGLSWPHDDPIDIELAAIRNKGRWRYQGKQYGEGLFHHYKALETQLWPWKRWDPWSELILKSLTENRMTLLSGPANASKTHSVAAFIVCHYLAFPTGACHLVSSTDSRSLELRIWGEIKKLWNEARARYEDTPGRLVESKQMIVTDSKWDKATDYRNGVIGVPCLVGGQFVGIGKYCFPAGTEVDTGIGTWPIQFMRVGDATLTAAGEMGVTAISSHIVSTLVRIHLADRKPIDCTPDHPFLTTKGWVNAIDLVPQSELISTHEAMSILREGSNRLARKREVLQPGLPKADMEEGLRVVRESVHSWGPEKRFLFEILRSELEDESTRDRASDDCREGFDPNREEHQHWNSVECQGQGSKERASKEIESSSLQREQNSRCNQWRADYLRENCDGSISECDSQSALQNRAEREIRKSAVLQGRFGVPVLQTGSGNRRQLSSERQPADEGSSQGQVFERVRVDRVEVLKPGCDPRFSQSEGGYRVYNLQVRGHPSYSVNGLLVHNCGIKSGRLIMAGDELQFMAPAFYDAIANLRKNPGFKFAGMFNPKDRTDVAGKLSEPCEEDGGWEGYSPTGKTMQWRVRFRDGVCLQLDGRDTPNNAAKEGEGWPFPYLINRDDIANDIALYGEDSWQVSSMDYGVFPRDAQARRIITRSMCERFRAQEEPVWSHEPLVTVFCMDAAYGAVGGDRCVGIELAFGKCSDGQTRLAFIGQPMVIPVKADAEDAEGKPIMPEDQIVNWVRAYCENQSRTSPIPLSHIGFDSTGRGSLVAAFARIWGSEFHAIEFGGQATDRPVSRKIQTPCREYYFNYCTQLWFDFSTLIVSDQCRAMPTSVMEEGCMRGWEPVKDKKVQIEPKSSTTGKPGCKQRMGRSPDLFDSAVIGLAVAQKLGFKLGGNNTFASNQTPRWLLELMQQQKTLQKSHRLKYR